MTTAADRPSGDGSTLIGTENEVLVFDPTLPPAWPSGSMVDGLEAVLAVVPDSPVFA